MDKLRILISVQNYRPAYGFGGNVTTAVGLAEGLARRGHSVSVVTSTVVDFTNHSPWRSRVEMIDGVTVHYLGTWLTFRKASINPAIFAFICAHMSQFDVLHIIGIYDLLGPVLAGFARRQGIPYSVEPCGMLVPIFRGLWLKRLYYRLSGYRLLKRARSIIVNSNNERNEALSFLGSTKELVVRYIGVNLMEFQTLPPRGEFRKRLGLKEDAPLVLWLGRIEPIKNLTELLMALGGLTDLRWELAIVGPVESREYLADLQSLARQLGISRRTHFVQPLYGAEKLTAYADADLFVLVSIKENWGNVVAEAIASGVPVIVADSCGVAQIVAEKAGLVVQRNVAAVREGIRTLLSDKDLYNSFKWKLPEVASELSSEESIRKMEELFYLWKREVANRN